MTPTDSASPRPAIVSVAFYLMLVLGVLSLIATLGNLAEGLLCLIAAWGIRRERAWSAYGLALLTSVVTGVLVAGAMLGERSLASIPGRTLALGMFLNLALVLLLFFAGRAIERRHGRRGSPWPWIGVSVLAGAFLTFFGLYQMPTGSMEDTLLVGDRIAVWKTHGMAPARGEMVVHIYPVDRKETFVKRVVGLPGDRVRIANKQLFINGAAVTEPYAQHKTSYIDSYRDNFPGQPNVPLYPAAREMLANNVVNGEVVVPPGRYFVLGDNRDESLDSRYFGFIRQSDIVGTPSFVYYSLDPPDKPGGETTLAILRVRWSRIFRTLA